MSNTHSKYLNTKYFTALDGLRAFCILAVLWHHSPRSENALTILKSGYLGVDMFFVLSGFLIVTLLLREKAKYKKINLKKFYVRRALRTFPIYYLLVFLVFLLYWLTQTNSEDAMRYYQTLPYYLTYTSNFIRDNAANMGIFWSLATEEQFYIFWPFLEKKTQNIKIIFAILGVALIVNQFINFGVVDSSLTNILGTTNLEVLDATFTPILFGVALAHILHHPRSFAAYTKWISSRWSTLILFVVLLLMIQFSPDDISGLFRLILQVIMTVILSTLVVHPNSVIISQALNNNVMKRLGQVSYGIYLYHMWVNHIIRELLRQVNLQDNPIIFFSLSICMTWIVAEISFRTIEAYFMTLKSKFSV